MIINELWDKVNNINNDTSYSYNPDVAVSTIENIYEINLPTKEKASQIVDDMVNNVISTSHASFRYCN